MKKKSAKWLFGVLLMFLNFQSFAQDATTTLIEPHHLAITYTKTTNLIFPYPIKSIDKGSRDVLVQKAIGVENVLQIKAAKTGFAETNLTIVTADGSLFSFVLNYADKPSGININVQKAQVAPQPLAVFTKNATNDIIQANAEKVAVRKQIISKTESSSFGASIAVKGIYVQEDVLYLQLSLQNSSSINYDIKLLRFFIRDKKKSKRSASQEIEFNPLFVLGNTQSIRSQSEQIMVVAVPKFTIPDKKVFNIQMQEENGGRNLLINVHNKEIFKASNIL